jgi:hypothetical protein
MRPDILSLLSQHSVRSNLGSFRPQCTRLVEHPRPSQASALTSAVRDIQLLRAANSSGDQVWIIMVFAPGDPCLQAWGGMARPLLLELDILEQTS